MIQTLLNISLHNEGKLRSKRQRAEYCGGQNKVIIMRKTISALVLAAALSGVSASALTAQQTVEREVIVKQADGTQAVKREKADMVTPGDKVVYTLSYYNDERDPADNIVLVMPIPAEVKYLEGSADMENARTAYSADGGKTFSVREALKVKQADGRLQMASADDITHVRWSVSEAVAPGASGTLSFSGRLK